MSFLVCFNIMCRNAVNMFNLRNAISTSISNLFRNAKISKLLQNVNHATINSYLLNYLIS